MKPPRDPARIDPMLESLREIWKRHPQRRLGQIVVGAWQAFGHKGTDPFYAEDDEMERALRQYLAAYPDVK